MKRLNQVEFGKPKIVQPNSYIWLCAPATFCWHSSQAARWSSHFL